MTFVPDPDILALGVRQPWVELILRGVKTIEVRSQSTQVRGTIYLYAARNCSDLSAADHAAAIQQLDVNTLPRGLLVGSVDLHAVRPARAEDEPSACLPVDLLAGQFAWELRNPQRFAAPLTVAFRPYGIWFYPYRRRTGGRGTR